MSHIRLKVPLYAQAKSNSCWNAAGKMIWDYSLQQSGRSGPMATHFSAYARADTTSLQYHEFKHFAEQVGLSFVPKRSVHNAEDLHTYLSTQGPILCAGLWFGVGHAIVLTGLDTSTVYFNDPDGAIAKTNSVDWFNDKLFSDHENTLMYKDPKRY